ncbi:MAG: alpha/beta hydrolase [Pseudomonadota bacterium]
MTYKQFVPLTNLNFQFNRVACYGEEACREEELWEIAPKLEKFNPRIWHEQWRGLALRAEAQERVLHAAYYHRMSEFFLPDGLPEKDRAYQDFRRCFYSGTSDGAFERLEIPYQGQSLPALRIRADNSKGTIILHGGFDSFMEEFYLQIKKMLAQGYSFVMFEGPGQGRTLRDGMKMTAAWEKPVSAVLDFLDLDRVTLIGVSLGGYLALRAAAFEPRIARVAAYDVVFDAFTCFTNNAPEPFKEQFREMVLSGQQAPVNELLEAFRKKDDLIDWVLTHGMYISGTTTPGDYFRFWMDFNTREISSLVKQDVLLLAGEKDHFVPVDMYYRQKEALVNARSVRGRLFTAAEGGENHCQVGALELAWREIIDWLENLGV